MNIYEALSKDHRQFEGQLDRLLAASQSNSKEWKTALDDLRGGLIAHAHAEEAVLYNALRNTKSQGMVLRSYVEHATAEGEIRTLGAAKLVDANWTTLIERLSKDLRHHIQEEESETFAAARAVFSAEEAEQMGAAFERLKIKMAEDGNSVLASTVDLVANLLPRRLSETFRKNIHASRAGD